MYIVLKNQSIITTYIIIEEFAYVAEIFSHFDATVCANLSNLERSKGGKSKRKAELKQPQRYKQVNSITNEKRKNQRFKPKKEGKKNTYWLFCITN